MNQKNRIYFPQKRNPIMDQYWKENKIFETYGIKNDSVHD
jgi:hypothetical protein